MRTTVRRVAAIAAAIMIVQGAAPAAPAMADTNQPLCGNTTYVNGNTKQTKNTNYGTATDLNMAGATQYGYIECVVTAVPAGATVTSATLDVFSRSVATNHTVSVYPVGASWSETGLTWNNQPTLNTTALASANGNVVSGAGEWVHLPVPVTGNGNGTYRYRLAVSGTSVQAYASDDYTTDITRRPAMTINYTVAPPAPTASFTAVPTSGTAPLAVQFTDTSTGSPTSWAWTFGDGGTSIAQNPAYTYAAAGTYTAILTASNATGSTSASQTVTVSAAPTTPVPTVPAGTVVPTTLAFDDEFDGTFLDTSKWTDNWFYYNSPQGVMNNTVTAPYNVAVSGGLLRLQLKSETDGSVTGALVHSDYTTGRYQLPVGGFTEARVMFPGDATQETYNWPAWWSSGPSWPAAGELDIAEGLTSTAPASQLTVNYHSPSGAPGFTPAGSWGNAFHTFGAYRKATSVDFYWDGALVWTVATSDNGGGQELIVNVGKSNSRTPVTGAAGEVQVDWVRAWQ